MIRQYIKSLYFKGFLILFVLVFSKIAITACVIEPDTNLTINNLPDSVYSIIEHQINVEKAKALIVLQNDSTLSEQYYSDCEELKKQTVPLLDRLTAMLLFERALNEGYIYSINEPASKYLPELPENELSSISLAQLLIMDDSEKVYIHNDTSGILTEDRKKEIKSFNSITHLYYLITERATGVNIKDYYKSRLNPIDKKPLKLSRNDCLFLEKNFVSNYGFSFRVKDLLNIASHSNYEGIQNPIAISHRGLLLYFLWKKQFVRLEIYYENIDDTMNY